MLFEEEIKQSLRKLHLPDIPIEIPSNIEFGDYAIPCFSLAKQYKKAPDHIAKELAEKIPLSKSVEKIEARGPYINFFLKRGVYYNALLKKRKKEGEKKETIVIDFSSPNVMKPFSVAHLRSTIIGQALANIYVYLGYNVIRVNHLGDWGTQFGKGIVAFKKWGNEKELQNDPIKYLLNLYVRFHKEAEKNLELEEEARQWFAKLEQGDKEARRLWKIFCSLSVREWKKLYRRLGISFDSWAGEAFYEPKLKETIALFRRKNILQESKGALVIDLSEYNLSPYIIQKSDGATIYATRDLAAAIYRHNAYKFDKCLYVVDIRQSLHFQQLFHSLEKAGFVWARNCVHVGFGLMTFNGEVMATRKGKVVFLEEVLDKAVARVQEIIAEKNPALKAKDKIAEMVGVGAVVFWDLVHDRLNDLDFDIEKLLDFDGETGPYVQYTAVRASSILRKVKKRNLHASYGLLGIEKEERILLNQLRFYEGVIFKTAEAYKPSILAHYLLTLAQRFNEFYQNVPCLSVKDPGLYEARLRVVERVRDILKEGLQLLGVQSPEEM